MKRFQLGPAGVLWTGRAELHLGPGVLPDVMRFPLRQVHGRSVVVVDDVLDAGIEADASVTRRSDIALAIATADCAPIALASDEGVIGAVHAGWRGLHTGVIENAVRQMRKLGAGTVVAALGPCICVDCYEFDGPELEQMSVMFGDSVVGTTKQRTRALNMRSAVASACTMANAKLAYSDDSCTSCDPNYFSFREDNTSDRQVMLVRRDNEHEPLHG